MELRTITVSTSGSTCIGPKAYQRAGVTLTFDAAGKPPDEALAEAAAELSWAMQDLWRRLDEPPPPRGA